MLNVRLDPWAGAVLLECEEGCECRPRQYSLRHWNHVSLVYWKPLLEVSLHNGTDHCSIRVSNPVRNSSDSKLKVCDHHPLFLRSTQRVVQATVQALPVAGLRLCVVPTRTLCHLQTLFLVHTGRLHLF